MYTKTIWVLEARWTSQKSERRKGTRRRNLDNEIEDNGMN